MDDKMYGADGLTPEQVAATELANDRNAQLEKSREEKLAEKRARRNHMSAEGIDDPLYIPAHMLQPGYKYFWAVDKPGRIQDLIAEGYEHVTAEDIVTYCGGKRGDSARRPTGQADPAWCYLMLIETELWQETMDMRNKAAVSVLEGVNQIGEGLSFQKMASVTGVDLDKRNALDNEG